MQSMFQTDPPSQLSPRERTARRELYFFALYRVLEAALLVGLCFSAFGERLITLVSEQSAQIAALAYLLGAVGLFLAALRAKAAIVVQVRVGIFLDLLTATTAFFAVNGLEAGIAAMLLVNVSAAALMLAAREAYPMAAAAALAVIAGLGIGAGPPGLWTEAWLFAASYLGGAALMQLLGTRMREAESEVQRQEADIADLNRVNAMILKRMRTGVLVVDRGNRIHQRNEAADQLLGRPPANVSQLLALSPDLAQRLDEWRAGVRAEATALTLGYETSPVIPRFARLGGSQDDLAIVFLDDVSIVSQQAEQLTLSSLGRLSASIAHEIRNPLAAINYAAELLGESRDLVDEERRLVDIIRGQCGRMNGIVENILKLARRDRSRPERIELGAWARSFVAEFKALKPLGDDSVEAVVDREPLEALVDPGQLHQIIGNLVDNARRYGRSDNGRAEIKLFVRVLENGRPAIDVSDRGQGVSRERAAQIFEPFFTTSDHSTGLGLYLARQLAEANLGRIESVPRDDGACFRVSLANV